MKPNPQQEEIIRHVDGPCLVTAVPGSGKTASLTERIKSLVRIGKEPSRILAITFTNKAADEMRRRIAEAVGRDAASKMIISTFHSLCARMLRDHGAAIGIPKGFSIWDEDDQERTLIRCICKVEEYEDKADVSRDYANDVMAYIEGKRNDCLTEEQAVMKFRIQGRQLKVANEYFASMVREHAIDFTGLLSEALRLLENPEVLSFYQRRWDYISVDEVQDTNIAQYELVKLLAWAHRNILAVGDVDQCIPGYMKVKTPAGDVPIEETKEGETVAAACGQGRTLWGKISRKSSREFEGDLIEIETCLGYKIRATPNHILFGRMTPIKDKHLVYLMYKRGVGYRVGRAKGSRARDRKQGEVFGLQVRANQEHADMMWIVKVCDSISEASYYEELLSTRYGLPTVVFHLCGRGNMQWTQEYIDKLYQNIDTTERAEKLFGDFGLFSDFPHLLQAGNGSVGRTAINLRMFENKVRSKIKPWHGHGVSAHIFNKEMKDKLEARGIRCRDSKRGLWRVVRFFNDYLEAENFAEELRDTCHSIRVTKKASLVAKTKPFVEFPAGNFHPGMSIAVCDSGSVVQDCVKSVKRIPYKGLVYDLEIKDVHNFVCSGVVCHNSIYAFRGAWPENVLKFEKDFGAKVLKLEVNYRSTPNILTHAQRLIENNRLRKATNLKTANAPGESPMAFWLATDADMTERIGDEVGRLLSKGHKPSEIAILYRTNYCSRLLERALRMRQIKYRVINGTSFYNRTEIKYSLAFLRLMNNPKDKTAFDKTIEACCKGVGPKTIDQILDVADKESLTPIEASKRFSEGKRGKPLKVFLENFRADLKPNEALQWAVTHTSFASWLADKSTPENDRAANVAEISFDVQEFMAKGGDLNGYLQYVSLLTNQDQDSKENEVKLMTMHGAKGLEFDSVIISHANNEVVPHYRVLNLPDQVERARQIEEERRLFYVAMTRARLRLRIYAAAMIQKRESEPSPFLKEAGIEFV